MYGKDGNYANSRLADTVVSLLGKLVMVRHVTDDCIAHCQDLVSGEDMEVNLDELDVKPRKLGWVNTHKLSCHYLARIPLRQDWRQGMRERNIRFINSDLRVCDIGFGGLIDCLQKPYPTFEECVRKVSNGHKSAAWSCEWAIDRTFKVLWRGNRIVGGLTPNKKPKLAKRYAYLKESLGESL